MSNTCLPRILHAAGQSATIFSRGPLTTAGLRMDGEFRSHGESESQSNKVLTFMRGWKTKNGETSGTKGGLYTIPLVLRVGHTSGTKGGTYTIPLVLRVGHTSGTKGGTYTIPLVLRVGHTLYLWY